MENPTWLWLDQAARRIAQRLAETSPDRFSKPRSALAHARKQLLDEAFCGSIEVQGKIGDPLQQEPQFSLREWEVVNSEYWNANHRIRRRGRHRNSDLTVDIIWANNVFSYENEEGFIGGFDSLRVTASDVDRIWPEQISAGQITAAQPTSPPSRTTKAPRNSGGRPSIYKDDIIKEIIRIANTPDGLPENIDELIQRVKKLNLPHWPAGGPSPNVIPEVVKSYYDTSPPKT